MGVLLNNAEEQIAQLRASGLTGRRIAEQLFLEPRRVYSVMQYKRVKARIAEIVEVNLEDLDITPEMVRDGIADIAYGGRTDTGDKLKAYKMLGDNLGMFVKKIEDVTDRGHDAWVKLLIKNDSTGNTGPDDSFLE